jgi:signal peptidase I
VYFVHDTHSMEPTLLGGDYIVIQRVPFTSLQEGEIITYTAGWQPLSADPVTHRIVGSDSYGLLLSGDNNARSEPKNRVTNATYHGKVIAIYRVAK